VIDENLNRRIVYQDHEGRRRFATFRLARNIQQKLNDLSQMGLSLIGIDSISVSVSSPEPPAFLSDETY
jgi:hypothetical protein